jgi:glucose dehydrogenase
MMREGSGIETRRQAMRDHGNGRFVLACLTVFLMLQAGAALAQSDDAEWEPITEERLLDPQDGDWMSYRRTYDVTGFSPLDQMSSFTG